MTLNAVQDAASSLRIHASDAERLAERADAAGSPLGAIHLREVAVEMQRAARFIEDDPIPRYAQYDLWVALRGNDTRDEYEAFREEHGFDNTWVLLTDAVRKLSQT